MRRERNVDQNSNSRAGPSELTSLHPRTRSACAYYCVLSCCTCKHTQLTPAHSSCHGSWNTLRVYTDGPDRSNGPEYKTVGSPDDNIKGIIEVGRQPSCPTAFLSNSLTLLPLARTVAVVSQRVSQSVSQSISVIIPTQLGHLPGGSSAAPASGRMSVSDELYHRPSAAAPCPAG